MRNLRKHILINPNFQIRFAALFTAAVVTFTLIFPLFVYSLFSTLEGHRFFVKNQVALQSLHEAKYDIFLFLIVMFLVTICTAFLLGLFHSHKIAGPLYKLRISMVAMQQGVLDHHIRFRLKDNFQELADGFNAMADAIFIRRRRDFERINSVIPKLELLQKNLNGEDQAIINEVLTALKELSQELPLK